MECASFLEINPFLYSIHSECLCTNIVCNKKPHVKLKGHWWAVADSVLEGRFRRWLIIGWLCWHGIIYFPGRPFLIEIQRRFGSLAAAIGCYSTKLWLFTNSTDRFKSLTKAVIFGREVLKVFGERRNWDIKGSAITNQQCDIQIKAPNLSCFVNYHGNHQYSPVFKSYKFAVRFSWTP